MTDMTTCRICSVEKDEHQFEVVGKSRRLVCVECRKAQQKAWRQANRESVAAKLKAWNAEHKEHLAEYHANYRRENREALREKNKNRPQEVKEKYNANRRTKRALLDPAQLALAASQRHAKRREKALEAMRAYAKSNPQYFITRNAERRAYSKAAVAKWNLELTELVTAEAGSLRELRKQCTGFDWHVDHVIPLRGKNVCGLHAYNNIAVVPEIVNRRKKNKFEQSKEASWIWY